MKQYDEAFLRLYAVVEKLARAKGKFLPDKESLYNLARKDCENAQIWEWPTSMTKWEYYLFWKTKDIQSALESAA